MARALEVAAESIPRDQRRRQPPEAWRAAAVVVHEPPSLATRRERPAASDRREASATAPTAAERPPRRRPRRHRVLGVIAAVVVPALAAAIVFTALRGDPAGAPNRPVDADAAPAIAMLDAAPTDAGSLAVVDATVVAIAPADAAPVVVVPRMRRRDAGTSGPATPLTTTGSALPAFPMPTPERIAAAVAPHDPVERDALFRPRPISVDKNPGGFDLIGGVTQALAAARSLDPDAELLSITGRPVRSDGNVDFTRDGSTWLVVYRFVSPKRAAGPGLVVDTVTYRPCSIQVTIMHDSATLQRMPVPMCAPSVRMPQCSVRGAIAKAAQVPIPPGASFMVTYFGSWSVTATEGSKVVGSWIVKDGC
jgi:hypothetical protein